MRRTSKRLFGPMIPLLLAPMLMGSLCVETGPPQCRACGFASGTAVQVTSNGHISNSVADINGCVTTDCGASVFDPISGRVVVANSGVNS